MKKKLRVTLRWRMTLLTIAVMLFSSVALVAFINMNVGTILPKMSDSIISYSGVGPIEEGVLIPDGAIGVTGQVSPDWTYEVSVQGEIKNAATSLYWGSLIILLFTIALGGVLAYFLAGSALKPIKKLNENIKKINSNNLMSNMPANGPDDEIKELTLSFNSMLAKLDNAFSSQKRFNASVAHELKTPIAAVKANVDVLSEQEEVSVEECTKTLLITKQALNKMNALVEALFESVQDENAALNDSVKLDEVIADVAQDLKAFAEKKDVCLTCDAKPVSTIMGNEILLYRTIYNLVENAIKYNKPQGLVDVSCSETGRQIEIKVSDTGNGIAQEELEKVFEPFYRLKKSDNQDGLGLGLALAKSVIAMHGGEISAESKAGEGTAFVIKLPIMKRT